MNNCSYDALVALDPLRNTSASVGGHFSAIAEVLKSQHSNSSQGCAAATVTKQQGTLQWARDDSRVIPLLQAESPCPPPSVTYTQTHFYAGSYRRCADRSCSKLLLEAALFPATQATPCAEHPFAAMFLFMQTFRS